ncbi:PASTA domain-containing protein [Mesorhizobium sp. IMUNJ 23232]|uniref:PASTA domain-containing protein n=1 Tax=Mesorhizobium sp. IMUNJ 23232 TaxID=3376064 RepID=UPI0037BB78D3
MEEEFLISPDDLKHFFALRESALLCLGNALFGRVRFYEKHSAWAAEQYGNASYQVDALDSATFLAHNRRQAVLEEVKRASVPIPDVEPGIMTFSGRVTSEGKSARGFVVTAYEAGEKLVGRAVVGDRGHFVLEVGEGTALRLVVFDPDGKEAHTDNQVYAFEPGKRAFVEIAIGKRDKSVDIPPDRKPSDRAFEMPPLVDKLVRDAEQVIKNAGLQVGDKIIEFDAKRPNMVLRQWPEPGMKVMPGDRVTLTVSQMRVFITVGSVPSLVGRSVGEARNLLELAGLKLGEITYVAGAFPSRVEAQDLKVESRQKEGTAVNVTISVPDASKLDAELVGDLFDLEATKAGIKGGELVRRLTGSGITTTDDFARLARANDEDLGGRIGIMDADRLKAVRAGLKSVQAILRKAPKPG